MARRARVDRTPEEKLEIVLQGMKSGNIAETCRRYEVAPNLYCRWKDEALQGATAALGGRSAAAVENEKDRRIRQLERSLGRKALEIEILKNVVGEWAAVRFTTCIPVTERTVWQTEGQDPLGPAVRRAGTSGCIHEKRAGAGNSTPLISGRAPNGLLQAYLPGLVSC